MLPLQTLRSQEIIRLPGQVLASSASSLRPLVNRETRMYSQRNSAPAIDAAMNRWSPLLPLPHENWLTQQRTDPAALDLHEVDALLESEHWMELFEKDLVFGKLENH